MIDQIISLLAHNSQNDQNHKSLELEIVVRIVVVVFLLLCCCCSSVNQLGYYPSKLFCCKSVLTTEGELNRFFAKN